MRILIVGAAGKVGSAAAGALGKHEIVGVGRSTTPAVDLSDEASIRALFDEVGDVDAVISASGSVPFKPAPELTPADITAAFQGKVLSQLTLAHVALDHVRDGGSITLTTGILGRASIRTGAAAAMANGALDAFVKTAAGEMPRGIRLNAVSPSVLAAAPGYFDAFPGFEPVSDDAVGRAFQRSVEGIDTGRVYEVD